MTIVRVGERQEPYVGDGGWHEFAGDPTPLSGDSGLVREANALCENWRKRLRYLAETQAGPDTAAAAVTKLHEAYIAEVNRAAQAGEISEPAPALKDKRDAADRQARETAWQDIVEAAQRLVGDALEAYKAFMEQNWSALISEKRQEATRLPSEHAKLTEQYRAKLAPVEQRWNEICEESRKIIGYIHPFTANDLPASDYNVPPLPSDEAIERAS